MNSVGTFFRKNWGRFLFSVLFTGTIIIIVNSVAGVWDSTFYYSNGLTISGFVLICIAGLAQITKMGGFDIFSFFFNRKKVPETNRKEDLYEYSARKKEERSKWVLVFLPYLITGVPVLIAGILTYYLGLM